MPRGQHPCMSVTCCCWTSSLRNILLSITYHWPHPYVPDLCYTDTQFNAENSWTIIKTIFGGDLCVPSTRTEFSKRSFRVAAPRTWNSFPLHLRSPTIRRQQFQSGLKTHLFKCAYTWLLLPRTVAEWTYLLSSRLGCDHINALYKFTITYLLSSRPFLQDQHHGVNSVTYSFSDRTNSEQMAKKNISVELTEQCKINFKKSLSLFNAR